MMRVHLTLKSSNGKTGPIPVSTTTAATCPDVCPFRKSGCYADGGPLAIHWKQVTAGKRGDDFATFCGKIAALPAGTFWRHNQAGDLPGEGDAIDPIALDALTFANAGRRGFTYSHKPVLGKAYAQNRAAIARANAAGFTINLSANNAAHADELAALGVAPVACVLPSTASANCKTPSGRKIVICPATQRDDVSCATCQMCQRQREVIVGFPAHGASIRKADAAVISFHRKG